MINPKIFRASYSVLNLWERGNWQEAIKAYYKLPNRVFTKQMKMGKDFHEKWQKEIEETGKLPKDFEEDKKLNKPVCELKIETKVNNWLEVVGVIDCYELGSKKLREFKTGVTTSEKYCQQMQVPLYCFLLFSRGEKVKRAIINHYNQYNKKADQSIIIVNQKTILRAWNWLESLASDMHSYLINNKIHEKILKEFPSEKD